MAVDINTPQLADEIRGIRRDLDRQHGEANALAKQSTILQAEVARLNASIVTLTQASVVLTSIGETRQATAQQQIEELVTRGLQTIFGAELSFHLIQSVKGKTPQVDFIVRSRVDGQELDTSVMDACGGGLVATVGFLLRLVVLILSKKTPILFLDEVFAHLSKEYVPLMAEFLRELVDKAGVQVLLLTHQDEFIEVADKVYRLDLVSGLTRVQDLSA